MYTHVLLLPPRSIHERNGKYYSISLLELVFSALRNFTSRYFHFLTLCSIGRLLIKTQILTINKILIVYCHVREFDFIFFSSNSGGMKKCVLRCMNYLFTLLSLLPGYSFHQYHPLLSFNAFANFPSLINTLGFLVAYYYNIIYIGTRINYARLV